MSDYKLHEILQQQVKNMTIREKRYFKQVLVETMPSYLVGAARVARTEAENVTERHTDTQTNKSD
jgi:hypothetical protein